MLLLSSQGPLVKHKPFFLLMIIYDIEPFKLLRSGLAFLKCSLKPFCHLKCLVAFDLLKLIVDVQKFRNERAARVPLDASLTP